MTLIWPILFLMFDIREFTLNEQDADAFFPIGSQYACWGRLTFEYVFVWLCTLEIKLWLTIVD